jgi:hypothetical protein
MSSIRDLEWKTMHDLGGISKFRFPAEEQREHLEKVRVLRGEHNALVQEGREAVMHPDKHWTNSELEQWLVERLHERYTHEQSLSMMLLLEFDEWCRTMHIAGAVLQPDGWVAEWDDGDEQEAEHASLP